MEKKCYEIKNCPFYTGEAPVGVKCPAFELKIGCWEFDWASFYSKMPVGKEKTEWRCGMVEKCKLCKVYKYHKLEMDNKFKQFK